MRILITGGTGFIGRHFIRTFPQYSYLVLTRSPQKARSRLPASVDLIASLDELNHLNDIDAVINLCGEAIADHRWTQTQKQRICESRWQPTRELVELCQKSSDPPRVMLSGSAIGYCGDTGSLVVSEDYIPHSHDFAHEVCVGWENIALQLETLVRVVLLRTSVVLGKHGGALKKMMLPFRMGVGGPMGSGKQYMSWIHQDDMVQAMQFLLEHEAARGAFNMSSPTSVTNAEFSRLLAEALGKKSWLPVPAMFIRLMLGEAASLVLESQRIYPQALLNLGFQFRYPELEPALTQLLKTG